MSTDTLEKDSVHVVQETPSLEKLFSAANAFHLTAALKGAVELEIFTAVAEGNTNPAAIAARCGASERGVRILCDYLTVAKFLTKADGAYGLSAESGAFLNKHSQAYLGSIFGFLAHPTFYADFNDIAGTVRKGGSLAAGQGTVEPDNPLWVDFARCMAPMMGLPSEMLARMVSPLEGPDCKVLDIAAGHGLYGIAVARHNPQAHIYPLDWAKVLEVARENAEKAGLAGRYHELPGSAFDVDFGTGYSLVLITNFLHHFDPATNEAFLRKVRSALTPGGRAVVLEFIPNEDRVSPPTPAMFSLIMLASTGSGDAYTFAEYQSMFANAGFGSTELRHLPPTPQQVIVAIK
jgi:2-polyprenyl-3-methyl-5-hydroxy-6-metoxy-1,4-benzoquinol methylase